MSRSLHITSSGVPDAAAIKDDAERTPQTTVILACGLPHFHISRDIAG